MNCDGSFSFVIELRGFQIRMPVNYFVITTFLSQRDGLLALERNMNMRFFKMTLMDLHSRLSTLSFDLSHFFDDIDVDEQTHGNSQEEEEAGRSATTETNILWYREGHGDSPLAT
ncbi:hypothetical protein L3X38_013147 [Prunus dulcis]|uniref:Uncharacterized protein n=1 Tax=Prunus dulcis TaxID=3755 RepID=A0AAD4WKS9_PRUDU|nr:hypothetical protein L3X38_013147 [Prunus dulcis]